MKKVFLFISISLISLSLVSCDETNEEIKKGSDESGWVQFETTSTSGAEGVQQEFKIPVNLVSVTNVDGTTVTVTATDVNNNNNGYLTWDSTVKIEKDEKEGFLNVKVNPAVAITGKIIIEFTLTATSNNFEVGLSDGSKTVVHRLEICPLSRDFFLGTYDVIEDGQFEYVSVITAGDAANELVISNVYDVNPATETRIFLNLEDPEFGVTFPPFMDNFLFTSSNPAQGNIYVSNGTGTYDSCNGVINLDFSLRFGPTQGSLTPPINLVLTKQ